MKKINVRTASDTLTNKELKSIVGGRDQKPTYSDACVTDNMGLCLINACMVAVYNGDQVVSYQLGRCVSDIQNPICHCEAYP